LPVADDPPSEEVPVSPDEELDEDLTERCERKIVVVNSQGLHARPAHRIVQVANQFPCRLWVAKDEFEVDAKSIMSLMMLAAEKGCELLVRAEGEQCHEAVAALEKLFAAGFGEA
jgi:phosphocarrier protein HPr